MSPGAMGGSRNPRSRSIKGRKMALASFPNQGHLLMDENAEYAQNNDRDTYLLSTSADGESLSDRQCYVRSHFVELFVATAQDVSSRHSRGAQKLHLNQIGLRCAYCVKLKPRDRAERAICYPSSISRIYQTVADMQRFHFESCVAIPPKVLQAYKSLKTTRPRGVGSPQSYWDKSAREIGLIDTEEGIQINDQDGGKEKLEKQKKSIVTGMLEQMDQQGSDQNVQAQGPVKDEELPLGAPVRGPQDSNATNTAGAMPSSVPAAVVSSPGSDNASKEEDEHNIHNKGTTPAAACLTPRSDPPMPSISSIDNKEPGDGKEVTMTSSTSNVEAEEDANILLMLKKTPESPPRNTNAGNHDVPVKEDQLPAIAPDKVVAV